MHRPIAFIFIALALSSCGQTTIGTSPITAEALRDCRQPGRLLAFQIRAKEVNFRGQTITVVFDITNTSAAPASLDENVIYLTRAELKNERGVKYAQSAIANGGIFNLPQSNLPINPGITRTGTFEFEAPTNSYVLTISRGAVMTSPMTDIYRCQISPT
jgi:hypothetical protein